MLAELDEAIALVAITVTVFGEGIATGAVYNPVAEIVPVRFDPPITPLTAQVTE